MVPNVNLKMTKIKTRINALFKYEIGVITGLVKGLVHI